MKGVQQKDLSDCGAACLAAVATHYKLRYPIALIRQAAGTNQDGTTVFGLIQAATKLGFRGKAVKTPFERLPAIPTPAIAHVVLPNGLQHFVVVKHITRTRVVVMNPTVGRFERISHDAFRQIWSGVLILLAPSSDFQQEDKINSVLSRFWQLVRPHKSVLFQGLLGGILTTILGLSTSFYVQKIVDTVVPDANRQLLNLMGTVMLIILAFRVLLTIGQKIDVAIILAYYKHLFHLPQLFFDTMRVGEIVSRTSDAIKIRSFLNESAMSMVVNTLVLVFTFATMFIYSWQLALLSFSMLALYSILFWLTNLLNRKYQRRIMERTADFDASIVQSLSNSSTIRRFHFEWLTQATVETAFVRLSRTLFQYGQSAIGISSAGMFLVEAYTITLLWIGSSLVVNTSLTPGQLLSCYALTGYLTGPAGTLLQLTRSSQEALIAADRLFEILDLETEQDQGTIDLPNGEPIDIRLEAVTFRYPGRPPILQNISLTFPKGTLTVLQGESGSGKSTIVALLQRLYEPSDGAIMFGEFNAKYIRLYSLRKCVVSVPQKIEIFSGSILHNIAPADFPPDLERVITICQDLGILSFIEDLPQGFQTVLTETGTNLSGGQRQRLAIARALYARPTVLVCDEPTASLDSAAEKHFLNAIFRLRDAGRTVVIIAHGRAFVSIADQVIMLTTERSSIQNRKSVRCDQIGELYLTVLLPNGDIPLYFPRLPIFRSVRFIS